jgi:hypothetical protein
MRARSRTVLLLLCTISPLFASLHSLEPYRWDYRLVLYTLAAEDAAAFEQRLRTLSDGIAERDVRFINLNRPGAKTDLPEAKTDEAPPYHLAVGADAARQLRSALDLAPGSTQMVLIGKDGGQKERLEAIDLEQFFAAIDRMPMRRAEIEAQRRGSD